MAEPALQAVLEAVALTDDEMRHVLRRTASEAKRMVNSLDGKEGVGARVRRMQIDLANQQAQMWRDIQHAVTVGIGDGVDAASNVASMFDEDFMRRAGLSQHYWAQSTLATAREGIDSFLSRKVNGRTLSERVYRNTALSKGYVSDAINSGLMLGKSAREIAADVHRFIDPATPGGASYAAMRLGRTEINNAYHETSRRRYKASPWVVTVQWHLSSSHKKPDTCDEYAHDSHIKDGEAGHFLPNEVPDKPHPQCFCFTTPETESIEEFARKFNNGEYDGYIQDQTGCMSVA